jgi:hypothetical protein
MKKVMVLVSALVLTAPLLAEEAHVRSKAPLVVGAVSHLLLPTSAYINGQFGAAFKTKISIANVTGNSYTIRAGFSTQAGEVAARNITIFGFETLTYENFLSDVFQLSGTAGAIDFDSLNTSNRFIVAAQVYVDGPNGRFSTAVQSADEAGTIIAGRPGYVVGVSADSFDRTNLGCASDSGSPQTITAQVYGPSNEPLGSLSFNMNPYGWNQKPVNIGVTNGILVINSTQRAVCYGVVVDNTSNDGTFQLAVPD